AARRGARDAERQVGGEERRAVDGERVARVVVADDGDALGDRRGRVSRYGVAEADGGALERDREHRLDVDVDRCALRDAAGRRRSRAAGGRRRGRVARGRRRGGEVRPVVVRVRAAVAIAQVRGRVAEARGRGGALVVGRGAVADQIDDLGVARAASGRGAAGEQRAVTYERHLAAGVGEVRRAGRVGGRKRRSHRSGGRELHEVVAARGDRAVQRSRLPARPACGGILDRPAAHVDGGRATVEQLDEVVREGGAAVAAAGV